MQCPNGHEAPDGAAFCPTCASIMAPAPSGPPAGWYADPLVPGGQRYWDGGQWSPGTAPQPSTQPVAYLAAPQPKSATVAILLTIFWPGAGHLYIGLNSKGVPYVVANAIGFVLGLTVILIPITILIWLVTMLMTVTKISGETNMVNQAIGRGERIAG